MDITIRVEQKRDYRAVEEVTREAFWNHHVPGCDEHYLLHILRSAAVFIPALSMVAERDGEIVGHIAYAKSFVTGDDGQKHEVLTFGPVSVHPDSQSQGIGSRLIETTLKKAVGMRYAAVMIYGDPAYYGRFGFLQGKTFGIAASDNFWIPSLQGLELVPGTLKKIGGGRFFEDEIYHVDENEAALFNLGFAPKEKKEGLPSQQHFLELLSQRTPRGME